MLDVVEVVFFIIACCVIEFQLLLTLFPTRVILFCDKKRGKIQDLPNTCHVSVSSHA